MKAQLELHPGKDFRIRQQASVRQLLGEAGILQHMRLGPNGNPMSPMVAISVCGSKTHCIVGVSHPAAEYPIQALALSKQLHEPSDAAELAMELMKSIGPAVKVSKVPFVPLVTN